ncbi:MAG TPA: COX15/CtaA family protein [Methylomirabilota bacterium]|nr:COX15/CtaA family protein [Methylomirabilota bacterium]
MNLASVLIEGTGHRLALLTLAATLVLIVFGGLVTNTGAALAVPDWPTTFGHNMFLYPWSRMVGGIFYEHSHRLIGSVVGLLSVALAVALWRKRTPLRWLGLLAMVAVVIQGVLGGLRVILLQSTLAIVHGCVAQAFFGLLVVIAVLTSPRARPAAPGFESATRGLTVVTAGLVYLQIVFGALLTHAGRIDLHLAGAAAIYVLVPIVAHKVRKSGDVVAARAAQALVALLGVQLALGVGSFVTRFWAITMPGGSVTGLLLPVMHRVVASLIVGLAVLLAMRSLAAPALRSAGTVAPVRPATEIP